MGNRKRKELFTEEEKKELEKKFDTIFLAIKEEEGEQMENLKEEKEAAEKYQTAGVEESAVNESVESDPVEKMQKELDEAPYFDKFDSKSMKAFSQPEIIPHTVGEELLEEDANGEYDQEVRFFATEEDESFKDKNPFLLKVEEIWDRFGDVIKKISVCVTAVVAAIFLLFGGNIVAQFEEKVEYPNFIQMVAKGEVEKADIDEGADKVIFQKVNDNKKYSTNYPGTDTFKEALLLNGVEIEIHEPVWALNILRIFGAPLLLILAMLYVSGSLKGQNGFEVQLVDEIDTTFDDVAGMDEVKEDLLGIVDLIHNPQYREFGVHIPKGVLMVGDPGNGKTLLARAFAGETKVNFIPVNACDFGDQFVGIGSARIKKLFRVARKNAPCIVFIDEIDAVGSSRSTAADAAGKEMNTILTSLLNQMDGFKQNEGIMVLAATNRPDDLDEALIRPGRFDREILINYPDRATRKKLFELYTDKIELDESVDIDRLVKRTYGDSCASIECLVNEAIMNAIKCDGEKVTMKNFMDAMFDIETKGHEKKDNSDVTKEEKELTAYHEAGHAIAAHFSKYGNEVTEISIKPTTSGAGGYTLAEGSDDSNLKPLDYYKSQLIYLYGGRAAEAHLRGGIGGSTFGPIEDIRQATKLAVSFVGIENGIDYSLFGELGEKEAFNKTKKILDDSWKETKNVVDSHWEQVEAVAKALMEKEVLNRKEFLALVV